MLGIAKHLLMVDVMLSDIEASVQNLPGRSLAIARDDS